MKNRLHTFGTFAPRRAGRWLTLLVGLGGFGIARLAATDYFADSANQPWYSIINPHGVYYNGNTYVVYQHVAMDPYIARFNHATNSWTGPFKVGTSSIVDKSDTHGNPALWIDSSGFIHVVYGGHGSSSSSPERHAKSTSPENITAWSNVTTFDPVCTYPQIFTKSSDTVGVFYRRGTHNIGAQTSAAWGWRESTDGGNTFDAFRAVTKSNEGDMYAQAAWGPDGRLHVCITWEDQPNVGRQDIYYLYRDTNNVWRNQNNEAVTVPIGMTGLNASCKIYDTGGIDTTTAPGMKCAPNGDLFLVIAAAGSGNFVSGRRAGDGAFTFSTITGGCNNWADQGAVDVLSNTVVETHVNSNGPGNGGFMERWRSTDSGSTWTKVGTTAFDDARSPVTVDNPHPDARMMFFRGSNFTCYLTGDSGYVRSNGILSPTAPAALSVTAGNGQVSLAWSASSGATSYNLLRSSTNGSGYVSIATGVTTLAYTDTGVTNGVSYYYVVVAVNPAGPGANSLQANATPLSRVQSWRQFHFGAFAPSGSAADDADPDGDGKSNKLEYATGSAPTVSEPGPGAILGETSDSSRLVFSFQRIDDPTLVYEVLASGDLTSSSWAGIWSSTGTANVAGNVSVTDTELIGAHDRRFLQLKISP